VEVPLLLQFCIALFTGMVAATLLPPVRRSIPRPVEVILWLALITVCVVGVMSVTDPNARELSASAAWGADQVINTTVGLTFGGFGAWLSDHRFAIASWLVIIAGADIFALMFLGSYRSGRSWRPRVRLREWMELPLPAPQMVPQRQVALADPVRDVNRRLAAATAVAGASVRATVAGASTRLRDSIVPGEARRVTRAAVAGRIDSRATLDALGDAAAHLRYAVRAWFAAAGQPAVESLATKASGAVQVAQKARQARLKAGQVIDIQALLNAQSIGWYGPFSTLPVTPLEGGEDQDATEPRRSDRMAS
jgi:hypothetical protein